MPHEYIDIAFGCITSACGWLIVRLVSRLDCVEERAQKNTEEIRLTRAALCRVEERVGLPPFPYAEI